MSFGIKGIFQQYGVKDLLEDIWIPLLLASILTIFVYISLADTYNILMSLLDFGIILVPVITTIILAAYVLLLSLLSSALKKFRESKNGQTLHSKLNSGFAGNLLISFFSIVFLFLSSFIGKLHFTSEYYIFINISIFWIATVLISYPIFSLFGILIDMFNMGEFLKSSK